MCQNITDWEVRTVYANATFSVHTKISPSLYYASYIVEPDAENILLLK
jgi:hypothetical protein